MLRLRLGILWAVGLSAGWAGVTQMACSSNATFGTGPSNNNQAGAGGGTGGGAGTAASGSSARGGAGGSITIAIPTTSAWDASVPDATSTATEDANCGSTTSRLEKKPADLLLVLDRSSSMLRAMDSANSCDPNTSSCSQRWATMLSSLQTVLAASPAEVYWGLKFFSSPSNDTTTTRATSASCNVSPGVEVAVAPGTADAIENQISQAGTATSTPTRLAIEASVAYLEALSDGSPKYILLATDGEPNCAPNASNTSNSDLAGTITAIEAAAAAGYKVFVIGVGPETGNLTNFAQAGGTDRFYPATTPEELSNALTTIVETVAAGCSYELGQAHPANPNAIGVYLDKSLIPQSTTDGWSYDAATATITINGSYCDDLRNGTKTQVDIFLPCRPDVPLPPVLL
jgi:hypothetical protein